jgi:hypothetical protein
MRRPGNIVGVDPVNSRKYSLPVAVFGSVMIAAAAAMAADLPKEGTSSVTHSAVGTGKVNQIGTDRFITAFDENG